MQVMDVYLNSPKGIRDRIEGSEAVSLRRIMPIPGNEAFSILGYIDPYDDTVFNSFQMTPFLTELNRLIEGDLPKDDRLVLEHLRQMALDCQQEVGRYLKFIGD